MKTFSLKLTALAFAAAMVAASGAHAASLFDDDDDGKSGAYHRQGQYCEEHPYADTCESDRDRPYPDRTYRHSYDRDDDRDYDRDRCVALVRAVGKRNLVTVFARNSARFAWIRETRFVHGDQYANWNIARDAEIVCTRIGALKSCEAIATPCRY